MFRRLAFVFFALTAVPLLCQRPADRPLDIYSIALVEAASEMGKQWGDLNPNEGDIATDYKHLLVYRDESVSTDYPESSGGRRFEYLTGAQLLARRKRLRKNFSVLIVYPARVVGPRVKVPVFNNWIAVRKGRLIDLISDWAAVYFRLDTETGEYKLDEVELGGI